MTTKTDTKPQTKVMRVAAVLAGSLAAFLVWVAAVPLAGIDLVATSGPVTVVSVLVMSLLAGLAGWLLLAVMERLSSNAARTWTWVASIFLALSLVEPLISADEAAVMATLAGMHLVTGAAVIPLLSRSARMRAGSPAR